MKHFGKIPDDSALPPLAQACMALVNLYACRMDWLNGDASGGGARWRASAKQHLSCSTTLADQTCVCMHRRCPPAARGAVSMLLVTAQMSRAHLQHASADFAFIIMLHRYRFRRLCL